MDNALTHPSCAMAMTIAATTQTNNPATSTHVLKRNLDAKATARLHLDASPPRSVATNTSTVHWAKMKKTARRQSVLRTSSSATTASAYLRSGCAMWTTIAKTAPMRMRTARPALVPLICSGVALEGM